MTPRENLLRLLHRDGYDEAPCSFVLCPYLEETFSRKEPGGGSYVEFFSFPWVDVPRPLQMDRDLKRFHQYYDVIDSRTTINEWGVARRGTPTSMHMTQILSPLSRAETVEEISDYPLPVYRADENVSLREAVRKVQARGLAAVGNMQCTIWETAWPLRGMEALMMDMMTEDPMAECLFARVEAGAVARAELYAQAGVDLLFLGDDIGTQRSIMMSIPLYQKWIFPALENVIKAAKRINPELLVIYHSCGYIEPFIPCLIDAGVDVLNPVQPECMDFEAIHRTYGDRLSFHGTIGTQTTMPFGTPEDVRAAVWKNLNIAGEKGGLFATPTHVLEPDVPWENVLAYVNACRTFRIR